jgi:hypothetical protein
VVEGLDLTRVGGEKLRGHTRVLYSVPRLDQLNLLRTLGGNEESDRLVLQLVRHATLPSDSLLKVPIETTPQKATLNRFHSYVLSVSISPVYQAKFAGRRINSAVHPRRLSPMPSEPIMVERQESGASRL